MCFKTIICTRGKWVVEQVQVRPIAYIWVKSGLRQKWVELKWVPKPIVDIWSLIGRANLVWPIIFHIQNKTKKRNLSMFF